MEPRRYGPFPYTPINRRPKLIWPNGARVAVWVCPNIEEVRPAEVRLEEVRLDEVWLYVGILFSPLIPGFHAFFEFGEKRIPTYPSAL